MLKSMAIEAWSSFEEVVQNSVINMSDAECRFIREILGNSLQGKPSKKMLAASLNALLQ